MKSGEVMVSLVAVKDGGKSGCVGVVVVTAVPELEVLDDLLMASQ